MRTDEKLKEICDELSRNCGDLHAAARYAGVSPAFLMSWMRDDDTAAKQIEEAQRVGWLGLESAAIERAVQGVSEDVWYKGEVVGSKQSYSDGLLVKLLEARVPAFNKKEGGNTFNGPTQINIMPRANNYEEWVKMRESALNARAAEVAGLPAPVDMIGSDENSEIIDAMFTVVDDRPLASLDLGV